MPLSLNEIKNNARAFSREWEGAALNAQRPRRSGMSFLRLTSDVHIRHLIKQSMQLMAKKALHQTPNGWPSSLSYTTSTPASCQSPNYLPNGKEEEIRLSPAKRGQRKSRHGIAHQHI